jgi:hypothetical protein
VVSYAFVDAYGCFGDCFQLFFPAAFFFQKENGIDIPIIIRDIARNVKDIAPIIRDGG